MKSDLREPCGSCPYRKDTPVKLWHRSEFENLLRQDANEYGGNVFGCHVYRNKPREEHRYCVGWLLDQRERNLPSIVLRLRVMHDPALGRALNEISDGGAAMYSSIAVMCHANGVTTDEKLADEATARAAVERLGIDVPAMADGVRKMLRSRRRGAR